STRCRYTFSLVLIWTSKFEVRNNDIYLKQSKAFIFILIGLLIVRLIAKVILSSTIHVGELSGMFWILAFGMIVPWRIAMLIQYRNLEKKITNHHIEKPDLYILGRLFLCWILKQMFIWCHINFHRL
ncbi:DUF1453 family protein, partial [Leptospira santarosai]|nr:DUF1453 family protein [Leptospira santarosai]